MTTMVIQVDSASHAYSTPARSTLCSTPVYNTRQVYDTRVHSLTVYSRHKRMLVPKGYCTAGTSIFFGFYVDAVSQPANSVN